jgi:carbonic anhydrase
MMKVDMVDGSRDALEYQSASARGRTQQNHRLFNFAREGLELGDAHIIRNAGGIVTEDTLRSLIVSCHIAGTQEVMIINNTKCGMLTFKDEELTAKLQVETGKTPVAPARFYAFTDLEENVRQQMCKVRSHPWIPESISVRGFIYDVDTGRLSEVSA